MQAISDVTNHTVAVYVTHEQAESAIKMLADSGYDIKNLSIVGQNYSTDEHPVGFINTGDRMRTWGKLGAFWGAIWGVLMGSAMLFVPGIGYVVFAGWIVSALEGALVGGSIAALGGALAGIGVPKDSVVEYELALKAGQFLVVAHGSEAEVAIAKESLAASAASRVDSYSAEKRALLI